MLSNSYRFNGYPEKFLVTVDEYQGEEVIRLKDHPDKLKKIYCIGRMNQKLFDAVCCQNNLEELYIKWGVYPDLTAISRLRKLKYLSLTAGASTKDISPLGCLTGLEVLFLLTVGGD